MNREIETPFFVFQEVSSGVYAAIAKNGQGAMANAGLVDLGESLLVFDTFTTPKAARELRKIAEETIGKRVKYVINSHYHGDHTFGNQVFEDAVIISTGLTREWHKEKNVISDLAEEKKSMREYLSELKERIEKEQSEINLISLKKQYGDIEQVFLSLEEMKIVWPNVTFENQLLIYGSERSVELYCFGGGHTISDTVMLIPDKGVLFAGDIIMDHHHPPIYHSVEFIKNLDNVKKLDFNTVIPGHGNVVSREQVDNVLNYLKNLRQFVSSQMTKGKTLEQVSDTATPRDYENWTGVDGYKRNLTTVFNEMKKLF